MKLDDPLNGYSGADIPELISCELKLTVDWRWFDGSMLSNTIEIERAKNFSATANWNNFNKKDHPEMVYAGGAKVSVPVSLALLGDFNNNNTNYPFSIDLTPLFNKIRNIHHL